MEWIKVEDRLPEKGQYVLVTFKSGFDNRPSYGLEIAEYYGNNSWALTDGEYDVAGPVIAWQELPKPYIDPEFKDAKFNTIDNHYYQMVVDGEDNWPEDYYMVQYTGIDDDNKTFIHRDYYRTEKLALNRVSELYDNCKIKYIAAYAYGGKEIKRISKPQ